MVKSWFLSKTLWYNLFMTIIDVLALASELKIGEEFAALYLIFAHGVGNIILRVWFTNTGLV